MLAKRATTIVAGLKGRIASEQAATWRRGRASIDPVAKVGLWETTAYALVCAVTLTKSLNIAETFPARQWSQTGKLREIGFDGSEKALLLAGVTLLIVSAYIEAVLLAGS